MASSAHADLSRFSAERLSALSGRFLIYAITVALAFVFMVPFLWTVSSSLKHVSELHLFPPTWFPETAQWANYAAVWQRVPFGHWLWNSTFISVLSVIGTIISSALVAYSFARFRYPGRDIFFLITLSTMMLPTEVTLIPTYLLFNEIDWLDTFKPLIVPNWFGGGAFAIFLMRQFFLTIPRELDDAARMDGASSVRIFWRILLPLCQPALATLGVITFISNWNAFMGPLIFLLSTRNFTVAVGLRYFQTLAAGDAEPTDHLLMAGSVLMAAPCIVLFFAAQRYFVRGIVMSGIKG